MSDRVRRGKSRPSFVTERSMAAARASCQDARHKWMAQFLAKKKEDPARGAQDFLDIRG